MQMNSTDEFRGRAMSVYTLVFAGSTPLGNLYTGAISDRFGAGMGFIACGVVVIALMVPLRIYRKKKRVVGINI